MEVDLHLLNFKELLIGKRLVTALLVGPFEAFKRKTNMHNQVLGGQLRESDCCTGVIPGWDGWDYFLQKLILCPTTF